jgi:hypothetical protein
MGTTIDLISPHNALTVTLRPPDIDTDPRNGNRVVKKGVKVRFQNGRARVDEETFALLQESPSYTGIGGRKRVWLADELLSARGSGTQVVQGALGTVSGPAQRSRPTPEWDNTGGTALAAAIKSGELVVNYEDAFAYEMENKRRKTVARALTDAMLGDTQPDIPELETPAAVALPDDIEGV